VSFWEENGVLRGVFISSVNKRSCAGRIFRWVSGVAASGGKRGSSRRESCLFFPNCLFFLEMVA
jgi:hypothetical protein